jgi:hypothetical protein
LFLGQRSYSLYLWHWPLIAFAALSSNGALASHHALLALATAVLLSDITYRYVENPIRRGITISDSATLLRGFATSSIIIVVLGLTAVATKGLLQRYDEPVRTYLEAAQYKSPRRCSRLRRILNPEREFCLARESDKSLDGRRGLLILGDSHADTVDEVVAKIGNLFGIPVYLTTRNCDLNEYGLKDYCSTAVRDEVFEQINLSNIGAVLVISFWEDSQIDADFDRNLAKLSDLDVQVILMETVPHGDYFDPTARAMSLLSGGIESETMYDMNSYVDQYPILTSRFAEIEREYSGRVQVLRPREYFCEAVGPCDFATDGYPNYFDDDHVNDVGAARLVPMFERVFKRLAPDQQVGE